MILKILVTLTDNPIWIPDQKNFVHVHISLTEVNKYRDNMRWDMRCLVVPDFEECKDGKSCKAKSIMNWKKAKHFIILL